MVVVTAGMVALGAVAVPMLCVSEAGLGAGFVVMATGTGAVCSYVCCCDDGITGVGGKADVRCMLLSVVAVLGWATVRGFADGVAEGVVALATVAGATEAAGTAEIVDVPALVGVAGVTGPVAAAIVWVDFAARTPAWSSAC